MTPTPTEWKTEREAFIAFSTGPAACVGKNVGRMEILLVVSNLLRRYTLRFAEGFDVDGWTDRNEEHIVMSLAPLQLTLERRMDV